jgi:hypothetical protein
VSYSSVSRAGQHQVSGNFKREQFEGRKSQKKTKQKQVEDKSPQMKRAHQIHGNRPTLQNIIANFQSKIKVFKACRKEKERLPA